MCDWIGKVTELLLPLYSALRAGIMTRPYLQADETTIKVQDGAREVNCHTGYLWGAHAPPNLIWFHDAPTRAGEVPKEIFKVYRGTVQTDAYAGYNPVFLPNTCQRIACLVHVRRKFVEVQKTAGKECMKVLKLIAELYRAETQAVKDGTLKEVRSGRTKQYIEELFADLHFTYGRILPSSPLAGAIRYAIEQEAAIRRITESGTYRLDNNSIEPQMKQIAIGRKNYLFAGSHDGAKRAALLYSLLNTAKLNKVNPWEWLRDILVRLAPTEPLLQRTSSRIAGPNLGESGPNYGHPLLDATSR